MSVNPARYQPETAATFLDKAGDGAGWRMAALAQLRERGIPTPRLERWRYTNLAAFGQSGALPASKAALSSNPVTLPWMLQTSRKLVFVNGYLALGDARLTLAGNSMQADFDTAPMERFDDAMLWAMNAALLQDGPRITVADTGQVYEIIHLGQGSGAPQLASPRTVIELADGAEATVIEQWLGTGEGVVHTNHATQIKLGHGAKLDHLRIQDEKTDRIVLSSTHAHVARDASYHAYFLNAGAALVRQEYWMEIAGVNASANVRGVQLVGARQHMDTTVQVDHMAPHGSSNQTIRNVLGGDAVGVFQGKIHVHAPAQKTDGYQLCNTLMLSPAAQMNTKPELEIYADDVKCSHGTTTGAMDEAPVFYLRSRGIPEAEARGLMLKAFIGDIFESAPECAQVPLAARAEKWLADAA